MNSAKQGSVERGSQAFLLSIFRRMALPVVDFAFRRQGTGRADPIAMQRAGGQHEGDGRQLVSVSARGLSSSSRRASAVAAPRQLPAMRRRLNQLPLYRRPHTDTDTLSAPRDRCSAGGPPAAANASKDGSFGGATHDVAVERLARAVEDGCISPSGNRSTAPTRHDAADHPIVAPPLCHLLLARCGASRRKLSVVPPKNDPELSPAPFKILRQKWHPGIRFNGFGPLK
jgi:hypothetical protein